MTEHARSDTHNLLVALKHPLRRQILKAMADEESSPRDLAETLDRPLSNVSYHVRVLVQCEVLKLVRTRQVRGSMQHFYKSLIEDEWARNILGIGARPTRTIGPVGEEIG
jgi:DNA-binding transcriptional ArsR family regulator